MTVIAWDGAYIAADRLADEEGHRRTISKLHVVGSEVLTFAGEISMGLLLIQWYRDGADPTKYPERQKTDDWTRLVVASKDGVRFYERQPIAIRLEDPFAAWGSGRDYALAAMHLGYSAQIACEVACEYALNCGLGVDVIDLKEM